MRTKTIAIILAVVGVLLIYTDLLSRWDLVLYDLTVRLWTRPPLEEIRIIAIDEPSLNGLGRWPWPRRHHVTLIKILTRIGVKSIGLDIIFSEPDKKHPDADQALADAIAANGRVVLPVLFKRDPVTNKLIEEHPLPILEQAAASLGHLDVKLDLDGIARSVFLKAGLGAPIWSSLPLAMLQQSKQRIHNSLPGRQQNAEMNLASENWVRDHLLLIPFTGPPGHIKRLSYVDVLTDKIDPAELRGKWVLIGITASGLGDTLLTPASRHLQPMPGVEFNANILDSLIQDITLLPMARSWHITMTILLVLVPILIYPFLPTRWSLVVWTCAILAIIFLTLIILKSFHFWFPPATSLLLTGISYPLLAWGGLSKSTQQLTDNKERRQASLNALGHGVIIVDNQLLLEYMNRTAEAFTGRSIDEVQSLPLWDVLKIKPEAKSEELNDRSLDISFGEENSFTLPRRGLLTRPSGENHTIWTKTEPIGDRWGHSRGHIITLYDPNLEPPPKTKKGDTQLDPLTGLPTRSLLATRLRKIFSPVDRRQNQAWILFINLDKFRHINITLGHQVGDRLLQEVAMRLKHSLRENDTLARLGSDEFVVVLEDATDADAVSLAARKLLDKLTKPMHIGDHNVKITASMGICNYPNDGTDSEILLKHAYRAMRRQKERGSNGFRFYAEQLQELIEGEGELESQLRKALDLHELELYYQPQLSLTTGKINGAEALIRWRREEKIVAIPEQFIPLAEKTGLIHPIGEWVLNSVCEQISRWRQEGLQPLRTAINLSAVELGEPGLLSKIELAIKDHKINPEQLELEITEGSVMRNIEITKNLLREFRGKGGQVSVDDFGTGYSTFTYLKNLPVDRLKIDSSFIRDMVSVQDDAFIILSIISMAHGLGLQVIAEGVEHKSQLKLLKEQQCDEIQGFLISKPLPPDLFATLLKR